jgi:hypothetical protein
VIHLTPKLFCESSYLQLTRTSSLFIGFKNIVDTGVHSLIIERLYSDFLKVVTKLIIPCSRYRPLDHNPSLGLQKTENDPVDRLDLFCMQVEYPIPHQIRNTLKQIIFGNIELLS